MWKSAGLSGFDLTVVCNISLYLLQIYHPVYGEKLPTYLICKMFSMVARDMWIWSEPI